MLTSTSTIIIAVFALCILALLAWVARLELRLRALTRGKRGSFERILRDMQSELEHHRAYRTDADARFQDLDTRLTRSVQGVGTVRFNPFRGTSGSNQSFATALLDAEGNGVVISSLYSRERVSVFAKPVAAHESEYGLSKEEREAIDRARR